MANTISQKHPSYTKYVAAWELMRNCREGQDTIKTNSTTYLPPTSAMTYDGMGTDGMGFAAYTAYKGRAVYPDVVSDAIDGMGGMVHRENATIELPAQMESMLASATKEGQTMQQLLEAITDRQLETGRLGIMADWPVDAPSGTLPYIVINTELSIINWDSAPHVDDNDGRSQLGLVVLDETGDSRDGLEWKNQVQYRVLALSCVAAEITKDPALAPDGADERYMVAVVKGDRELVGDDFTEINSGVKPVENILFEFINACDSCPEPDKPPLKGLADMSLTIYRGEADYRQSLFMQGQDTLVVKGKQTPQIVEGSSSLKQENDVRTGTGAVIHTKPDGDAKYIGVSGQGLAEQRKSLENDYARANAAGAKLLDNQGGGKEGAEALHIRVSTRTATLPRISSTGAAALQSLLRKIARSMNFNEDEVKVEPNKDYAPLPAQASDILQLTQAKAQGLQISWRTIHDFARRKDITRLTYDDEQEEIATEPSIEDLGNGPGIDGGLDDEDG